MQMDKKENVDSFAGREKQDSEMMSFGVIINLNYSVLYYYYYLFSVPVGVAQGV